MNTHKHRRVAPSPPTPTPILHAIEYGFKLVPCTDWFGREPSKQFRLLCPELGVDAFSGWYDHNYEWVDVLGHIAFLNWFTARMATLRLPIVIEAPPLLTYPPTTA
ncbi:MAG: hypothetical protein ACKO0Z_02285 [Betaproteobacteria bacterium]